MPSDEVIKSIMNSMEWPEKKVLIWCKTPNPLLGGLTPEKFELVNGKERLEKWIEEQLDEKPRD